MAGAIIDLGHQLGEGNLALSAKTVGRWERGESRPRAPYPKLLCTLLATSAEELCLQDGIDLGLARTSRVLDPRLFPETLVGALGSRLASPMTFVPLLPAETAEAAVHGAVDARTGSLLANALRALRRLDDRLGSLAVTKPALELRGLVEYIFQLLPNPSVRDGLLGVAAELNQFLGWMAYDAGDHSTARGYYQDGLRPARESDQDLASSLTAHIALLAIAEGKSAEALAVIDQSFAETTKGASPLTRSLCAAVEAKVKAVVGEEADCRSALDRARTEFDHARSEEPPPCLYFFDEAELLTYEGSCFERIGQPELAQDTWGRALKLLGPERVRDRARCLVHLAHAYSRKGDLDRACASAGEALAISVEVASRRVRRNVERMRAQWEVWKELPVVRELDQLLALAP